MVIAFCITVLGEGKIRKILSVERPNVLGDRQLNKISYIFHDKLDGHTKLIVISDFFKMLFCARIFNNGFQRFSNVEIFKNQSIMCA